MSRFVKAFTFLIMLLLSGIGSGIALAGDKIGIVLMHGKSGSSGAKGPIGKLIMALEQAGILVSAPDMPWSRKRMLAKDYEASMKEIDDAVAQLKAQGASRIVVGGHSMGANAAIGYGARREGLAGIIALAPGHVPEIGGYQKRVKHDFRRAAALVNKGDGNKLGNFLDNNEGKVGSISTTAKDYLSWYDPDGPAPMPRNAASLKPDTPLLWAIGREDRMFRRGEDYAFSRAPQNPKNLYLVVEGGHKQTPSIAAGQVIEWLNRL